MPIEAPAPAVLTSPTPERMTVWTTSGDGIAALTATTAPVPVPGPTEVLVRISAVALNYRDLLVIGGVDGWRPAGPVVPISDGVGYVVATGSEVHRWRRGDRVSPPFLPLWRSGRLTRATYVTPTGGPVNRGMLAEYVVMDQDQVIRTPSHLDDVHAAAVPVAAVTAWHAVARRSRVRAGETVLIHGTGGVALFAAQIALALGARPIVTSSSDAKLAEVRALGAIETVNYRRTPDVAAEVVALTGGDGVDHVIETVGGANLNVSLAAVRIGGTISMIGLIAGLAASVNIYEFVTKNVTVHGIETGSLEMHDEVAAFVDEHRLVPLLDSVHPVEQVQDALRHLESGAHFGKIVVTLGPTT